jgi:YesN/AraC family two-component response regulator
MVESLYSITECRPILVVDDDPQACEMYERIIAEAFPGSLVQSAADGQIAIDILKSIAPAIIILDLIMPRVDGFKVLEYIRSVERLQSVPVLVMSGKLLTEQDARRLDYGRVFFQSKKMLDSDEAITAFQAIASGNRQLPQPTSKLVKNTLVYLHQYYAMQLNRKEIASAVGVSEGYLSEIFKLEMGISPWDTLIRLRIQRACELLKTSEKSITDISTRVGFDDPSYFGRVFKKIIGISPKAYREL